MVNFDKSLQVKCACFLFYLRKEESDHMGETQLVLLHRECFPPGQQLQCYSEQTADVKFISLINKTTICQLKYFIYYIALTSLSSYAAKTFHKISENHVKNIFQTKCFVFLSGLFQSMLTMCVRTLPVQLTWPLFLHSVTLQRLSGSQEELRCTR